MQGTSSRALRFEAGRQVALVGLGKADSATTCPEWGVSTYQAAGKAVAALAKANKAKKVHTQCYIIQYIMKGVV